MAVDKGKRTEYWWIITEIGKPPKIAEVWFKIGTPAVAYLPGVERELAAWEFDLVRRVPKLRLPRKKVAQHSKSEKS